MHAYLDFERPIAELEGKIVELRQLAAQDPAMEIDDEVARLQARAESLINDTYAKLTPWQKALVARHPARPHFSDYVSALVEDFTPLAGDRLYSEDRAIISGLGAPISHDHVFRNQAVGNTCTVAGSGPAWRGGGVGGRLNQRLRQQWQADVHPVVDRRVVVVELLVAVGDGHGTDRGLHPFLLCLHPKALVQVSMKHLHSLVV